MKKHTVFYKLVKVNGRLRLKLWEPMAVISPKGPRHQFAVNYSVTSEIEANQLVAQYVKANRAVACCLA
ncbi:MAG: hypothetical protein HC873_00480 [Leptolyngbyaceae cyanobacterium SL_1_1]|nr:hypothetical protein [Leptolyngbyaceae cyanobacterium RM1_1_2]NJO08357.1 hypothetical protein [Leptolyngbyaceae cyanobacterium SL_1_1]